MSAHARFPVDPAARIAPDKLDSMADDAPFTFTRQALRQGARDARTLERLRAWLEAESRAYSSMHPADRDPFHYGRHMLAADALAQFDTLERDSE